jgi:hypothetical protein
MIIPYTWHTISPTEQAARKDFFTLMEWVRLRQYNPPRHEWRMIQQVFDEVFHRTADTCALVGLVLGLPFSKKVERDFWTGKSWVRTPWQRAKMPLALTLLGHEVGMRLLLTYPAEEFWQVVTRMDSDLGNAARQIRVLEEQPSPDRLQFDQHRWVSNIAAFPYQILTSNQFVLTLLQFISVFTLRDTLGSAFGGTALMDRRMVGPGMEGPDAETKKKQRAEAAKTAATTEQTPPTSTMGRLLDGVRGKAENQPESGSSITDVIKIQMTTRFFKWTPIVWTHVSTPVTKVNSVSIGLPISSSSSHAVQWTLKSKGIILDHAQYGARVWWAAHLGLFGLLTPRSEDGAGKKSGGIGGSGGSAGGGNHK